MKGPAYNFASLSRYPLREPLSRRPLVARCCLAASALTLAAMAPVYWLRPIGAAAVTIWPVWVPFLVGIWLLAAGWSGSRRMAFILLTGWLVYLAALAEEARTVPRLLWLQPARTPPAECFRVISLNCAVGGTLPIRDALTYEPDLLLLQESPSRQSITTEIRRDPQGPRAVAATPGCAIAARGTVLDARNSPTARFARARIRLQDGQEIEAISARFLGAVIRTDYWNPACWRAHAANRRTRLLQMRRIARHIRRVPPHVPVIFGGDFNVPQGDSVFHELPAHIRDSFDEAGTGWGNTFLSVFPVLRIDQIHLSPELTPRVCFAASTRHSDHRMVICDVALPAQDE